MNESLDSLDYPPFESFTISDHVRNIHDAGVSIKMICQILDLRQETVERWLESKDNAYMPYVGGEI